MANKNTTLPTSKLPTKWLAIIIFVLVGYGLCQPFVTRKFGWNWPSLSSILGLEDKANKADGTADPKGDETSKSSTRKETGKKSSKAEPTLSAQELERQLLGADSTESGLTNDVDDPTDVDSTKQSSQSASKSQSTPEKNSQSKTDSSKKSGSSANDPKLLYGVLKDLGRENYASPAGLRYTRGSEEGHRLKHIERHLEDQPDRPGSHGVFDGDMAQVLRWIDDAYTRGKSGAKGTTAKEEKDDYGNVRMVYEASFTKPIGYQGGRSGADKKNPSVKRLKLVVDKELRVITAFPF